MTTPTQQRSIAPATGDEVVTMDGQGLGRIKEIRGSYFLVKKGFRRHAYWLDSEFIYDRDGESGPLMVALLAEQLDAHKVPESIVQHKVDLDPNRDKLLSDEAMREQRERMERSLRH